MISIGIGALIFAIWLIILFFGKSIGLSMLLFVGPFSIFSVYMLKKNNKIKNPKFKILLIPILLLATTYFIFNNSFFNSLNLIIIPVLQSILILGLLGEKFEISFDTTNKMISLIFSPFDYIGESAKNFITNIKTKLKIDAKSNNEKNTKKVLKAILITMPIVLIIIFLLSTADETFANIFSGMFDKIINLLKETNVSTSIIKIICIIIAFFYLIGFFYYIFLKYEIKEEKAILKTKRKDSFTIKMILVSLNIIYLVFCYIQIKSLFINDTTINYANYARQGFFQLMIVSIINIITILVAKRKENSEEIKTNKFINYMSIIMIIFTFIIVASAWVRMHYYENAYGYTLLRLLVYCTLFTESIMLIPTIMYILDKKINLLKAYFSIIMVVYVCMNLANFDNIIAKRNVDRFLETGKIDIYYLEWGTGTDAINQILRIFEAKTDEKLEINNYLKEAAESDERNLTLKFLQAKAGAEKVKVEASRYLKERYKELNEEKMDFRDFNLSKIFAKSIIEKALQ